jgi:hypothetical protein
MPGPEAANSNLDRMQTQAISIDAVRRAREAVILEGAPDEMQSRAISLDGLRNLHAHLSEVPDAAPGVATEQPTAIVPEAVLRSQLPQRGESASR